jgi:gamma-glutamyltranspeptidase/glutathione hydrolase
MTLADPTGQFPYPSRRMPVWARHVVATSQPLAAQAGVLAMRAGGNAIDAALTAAITLTVVEPTSNGVGSDAFAIVWADGALHGLNGSGRSPMAWTPQRFAGREAMPDVGWDSVTVPGAVDAWRRLSERFGRLPFARLFEPAIRYAREGFPVSPITAAAWQAAVPRLGGFAEFSRTFLPEGRAPRAGEVFRCPELAETLASIAATRGESFYRGELAERIVAASAAGGGAMTAADLALHGALDAAPLSVRFRDVEVHELPPNGQGLAALVALGVLERLPIEVHEPGSADAVHFEVEAMKLGISAAHLWVADPDAMEDDPKELIEESRLDELAGRVDPRHARPLQGVVPVDPGTVYLAAGDADGNMVSFIQSNYRGFGSGIVVPGTGISLQNRGSGFTLQDGHPNRVAGGKRPFHTIIPAFVTRDGAPEMALGVMGGPMQPQGHLQLLARIVAYGQVPQAASDAPRWFVDDDGSLVLEPGFPVATAEGLRARGHVVALHGPFGLFGGAQVVRKAGEVYEAASDSRKDGQAVGF